MGNERSVIAKLKEKKLSDIEEEDTVSLREHLMRKKKGVIPEDFDFDITHLNDEERMAMSDVEVGCESLSWSIDSNIFYDCRDREICSVEGWRNSESNGSSIDSLKKLSMMERRLVMLSYNSPLKEWTLYRSELTLDGIAVEDKATIVSRSVGNVKKLYKYLIDRHEHFDKMFTSMRFEGVIEAK